MVVDGEADRQSAMYRDEWDHHTHLLGALNHITFHNTVLNRRLGKGGSVRSKGGDVGTMHAIGTGFDFNGAMRPYASNLMVPERLLRNMVLCLARCGKFSSSGAGCDEGHGIRYWSPAYLTNGR
ncbi:hypothetical protein MHU86_2328 [Fragilaria crotonensis]|nr:hypothetical protein MHU86_2328 [Fragilaria crotonensis]